MTTQCRPWRDGWLVLAVLVDAGLALVWSLGGLVVLWLLAALTALVAVAGVDSALGRRTDRLATYLPGLLARSALAAAAVIAAGTMLAWDGWLALLLSVCLVVTHPAPWRRWHGH